MTSTAIHFNHQGSTHTLHFASITRTDTPQHTTINIAHTSYTHSSTPPTPQEPSSTPTNTYSSSHSHTAHS